jgi:hypothetical protein
MSEILLWSHFVVLLKSDLGVQQTHLSPWFVEQVLVLSSSFRHHQIHKCQRYNFGRTLLYNLSQTQVFNKPTLVPGLLNKCLCLARALGVTKFTNVRDITLVALSCAAYVRLRCSTIDI